DESEQRLVISSEDNNISELALLKSYTKTEKEYQGVYDVSIRLMEYVPVSVRTTDVPYVKRPGKVPVPPTVTFNGGTVTPYSVAQGLGMAAGGVAGLNGTVMGSLNGGGAHYTLGGRVSGGSGVKLTDNNGKPIDNPNMLENGIEYIMKPIREEDHAGAAAGYALGWVKKAFEAAGNLLRSGSD
ncbi:MAG: hypothetical protein LBV27_09010, partial [Oscillospiraceae bacterium]|nr:hypothetical protein [Oscillospiraceae bacterium]